MSEPILRTCEDNSGGTANLVEWPDGRVALCWVSYPKRAQEVYRDLAAVIKRYRVAFEEKEPDELEEPDPDA